MECVNGSNSRLGDMGYVDEKGAWRRMVNIVDPSSCERLGIIQNLPISESLHIVQTSPQSGHATLSVLEKSSYARFRAHTGEWYGFDRKDLLGRYSLLNNLGPLTCARGGYGRVYRGVQESTAMHCAIKEMMTDETFDREIRLMNLLPEHVTTFNGFS
jgi:serine/threonine protein kinase